MYTQSDVFRMILRAAVPIPLSLRATALLVADLEKLAQAMPHDDPAGVYLALASSVTVTGWWAYIASLKYRDDRRQALDRVKTDYPALRQE